METIIPLAINRLQHIGIPVTNLERSVHFYKRLGFAAVMQAPFYIDGAPGICTMLERAGMLIELYQLPELQLDEIRHRKAGRIDHIAFDVDDIDEAFNLIRDAGIPINESSPVFLQFWEKGCKYFTFPGPDGETLECNQILR